MQKLGSTAPHSVTEFHVLLTDLNLAAVAPEPTSHGDQPDKPHSTGPHIVRTALPATIKAVLATTKAPPATIKAVPATTKALPSNTKAPPATVKAVPATTNTLPATIKAPPATTKAVPTTTKAAPATTKAVHTTTKAAPATTKTAPSTTKAAPSTTKAPPASTKAVPTTIKAPLATTKAVPTLRHLDKTLSAAVLPGKRVFSENNNVVYAPTNVGAPLFDEAKKQTFSKGNASNRVLVETSSKKPTAGNENEPVMKEAGLSRPKRTKSCHRPKMRKQIVRLLVDYYGNKYVCKSCAIEERSEDLFRKHIWQDIHSKGQCSHTGSTHGPGMDNADGCPHINKLMQTLFLKKQASDGKGDWQPIVAAKIAAGVLFPAPGSRIEAMMTTGKYGRDHAVVAKAATSASNDTSDEDDNVPLSKLLSKAAALKLTASFEKELVGSLAPNTKQSNAKRRGKTNRLCSDDVGDCPADKKSKTAKKPEPESPATTDIRRRMSRGTRTASVDSIVGLSSVQDETGDEELPPTPAIGAVESTGAAVESSSAAIGRFRCEQDPCQFTCDDWQVFHDHVQSLHGNCTQWSNIGLTVTSAADDKDEPVNTDDTMSSKEQSASNADALKGKDEPMNAVDDEPASTADENTYSILKDHTVYGKPASVQEEQTYHCDFCSIVCKEFESFKMHLESVHSFHEVKTDDAFPDKKILALRIESSPQESTEPSGSDPLQCKNCPFTSKSKDNMAAHNLKHSSKLRTGFKCMYCSYSASQRFIVARHALLYHPDRPRGIGQSHVFALQSRKMPTICLKMAKSLLKTSQKNAGTDGQVCGSSNVADQEESGGGPEEMKVGSDNDAPQKMPTICLKTAKSTSNKKLVGSDNDAPRNMPTICLKTATSPSKTSPKNAGTDGQVGGSSDVADREESGEEIKSIYLKTAKSPPKTSQKNAGSDGQVGGTSDMADQEESGGEPEEIKFDCDNDNSSDDVSNNVAQMSADNRQTTDTSVEITKTPMLSTTVLNVKPVTLSNDPLNVPRREPNVKSYKCIYCDFSSDDCFDDIRDHIFVGHLHRNHFNCINCEFGSITKVDFMFHYAKHHSGKHTRVREDREYSRNVSVLETHGEELLVGMLSKDNVPLMELPISIHEETLSLGETCAPEASEVTQHASDSTVSPSVKPVNPGLVRTSKKRCTKAVRGTRICKECGFSSATERLVDHHVIRCHLPAFACPYCSLEVDGYKSFQRHVKTSHPLIRKTHVQYITTKNQKLISLHVMNPAGSKQQSVLDAASLDETHAPDATEVTQQAEGNTASPGVKSINSVLVRTSKKQSTIRAVHGTRTCKECGFSSVSFRGVANHVIRCHMQSFACPYCSLEIDGYKSMLIHAKASHPLKKNHVHYITTKNRKLIRPHVMNPADSKQHSVLGAAPCASPMAPKKPENTSTASVLGCQQKPQSGTHYGNRSTTGDDERDSVTSTCSDNVTSTGSDSKSTKSQSSTGSNVAPSSGFLWKCSTCGTQLVMLEAMRIHVLTQHMNLQPYQCAVCDFGGNSTDLVESHIRETHQHSRIHIPVVDVVEEKVDSLKKEMIRVRAKKAPVSTDASNSEAFDYSELCTIGKSGESVCKCDLCEHEANSNSEMTSHRLSHGLFCSYDCGYCDHKSDSIYLVQKHTNNVHTGRPLKYEFSEKSPDDICDEVEHATTVTDSKVPSSAGQHTLTKTTTPNKPPDSNEVTTQDVSRTSAATTTPSTEKPKPCCIVYEPKKKLDALVKENVVQATKVSTTDDANEPTQSNTVETSEPKSDDTNKLKEDKRQTPRHYKCVRCQDYTTTSKSFMMRHLAKEIKYFPFECPHCPHSANRPDHVKAHIRLTHSDPVGQTRFNKDDTKEIEMADLLELCTVDDTNKRKEDRREASKHYTCVRCKEYTTTSKAYMLRHLAKEIKYFPFGCPHCAHSANRQDHMKRHIKETHSDLVGQTRFNKDETKESEMAELLERCTVVRGVPAATSLEDLFGVPSVSSLGHKRKSSLECNPAKKKRKG